MVKTKNFLALDVGAESGRAILGRFDGERLELSEQHRFSNGAIRVPGPSGRTRLYWDILHLWNEVMEGITRVAGKVGNDLAGIGLDTWAIDFGLLDRQGSLLGNPYNYRDSRTDGMLEEAFRRMPRDMIFELTGIQFMQINTLYQLLAMATGQSPALEAAKTFLTIPDLLNYWLTGRAVCEFTNATTTQCYDPRRRAWSDPLLQAMGIPRSIFPEVIQPGTVLGPLSRIVAEEVNSLALVIAPATHDTGSAVAAVPASDPAFAWISSGTWSVVGTELPEPVISAQSLANNFTNEGGVQGTFRFSKNVMGLWLLQECRRTWRAGGEDLSYDELTEMAKGAAPLVSIIDPDWGEFLKPGDMPRRIQEFCRRTGQVVPESKPAIVRCILESIALKYRWIFERLGEMTGKALEPIHIVGGGTQNHSLSQFTADATGRTVNTGPVEATATGNILMQAVALGDLNSIWEGRQMVRASTELLTFEPGERGPWDEAYGKLLEWMAQ